MIETIDWGGQAFPSEGGVDSGLHPDPGMSLRDWFAGQALAGFMANKNRPTTYAQYDAEWAYTIADAMLAARKAGVK